jgi:hypothetical protein
MNGIEVLLMCTALYKARDPNSAEEEEFMQVGGQFCMPAVHGRWRIARCCSFMWGALAWVCRDMLACWMQCQGYWQGYVQYIHVPHAGLVIIRVRSMQVIHGSWVAPAWYQLL